MADFLWSPSGGSQAFASASNWTPSTAVPGVDDTVEFFQGDETISGAGHVGWAAVYGALTLDDMTLSIDNALSFAPEGPGSVVIGAGSTLTVGQIYSQNSLRLPATNAFTVIVAGGSLDTLGAVGGDVPGSAFDVKYGTWNAAGSVSSVAVTQEGGKIAATADFSDISYFDLDGGADDTLRNLSFTEHVNIGQFNYPIAEGFPATPDDATLTAGAIVAVADAANPNPYFDDSFGSLVKAASFDGAGVASLYITYNSVATFTGAVSGVPLLDVSGSTFNAGSLSADDIQDFGSIFVAGQLTAQTIKADYLDFGTAEVSGAVDFYNGQVNGGAAAFAGGMTLETNADVQLASYAGGAITFTGAATLAIDDAIDGATISGVTSGSKLTLGGGGPFDVTGSGAAIAMNDADVSATGGGFQVHGSGYALLADTAGNWDTVSANDLRVTLTAAQASVVGGGDFLVADAASTVSLYETANLWDVLSGSNLVAIATNAQVSILGGGDVVYAYQNSTLSLYDTGADWDTVYGGGQSAILTSASASLLGGGDTAYLYAGSVVSLYNTAGVWDTIYAKRGQVLLNQAQASVIGGDDAIAATAGSAISLYGEGGDSVAASGVGLSPYGVTASLAGASDWIYFSGASSLAVNGGGQEIVFAAGSGQASVSGFTADDTVQLAASPWANYASLLQSGALASSGANTILTVDAADKLTLVGVAPTSLTSANFVFG